MLGAHRRLLQGSTSGTRLLPHGYRISPLWNPNLKNRRDVTEVSRRRMLSASVVLTPLFIIQRFSTIGNSTRAKRRLWVRRTHDREKATPPERSQLVVYAVESHHGPRPRFRPLGAVSAVIHLPIKVRMRQGGSSGRIRAMVW